MREVFTRHTIHSKLLLLLLVTTSAYGKIDSSTVAWKDDFAVAKLISNKENLKKFKLTTTAILRDNFPSSKEKVITQDINYPLITSGSELFDALYALTVKEINENSVERITDHSFSTEDCHCFETGKKWNYVWTRDISYSADLSLANLNQKRTLNSLLFKVSKRRGQPESSSEIVQDTGTGGSWPISTDRVVWALASQKLLNFLTGSERQNFLKTSYIALKNTINNDRLAIYDSNDGLYTGEQSFLDWREQTYPNWVTKNVIHIGMSKSLSTNITHYIALKNFSLMALELGKAEEFKKYNQYAIDLKNSINTYFWDDEAKQYSTFITTYLNKRPAKKYDLLGISLAILHDIPETQEQRESLKNYKMVEAGAPVVWPQDQDAAVYHNRGIWPFVTQYGLLAAKKNKQAKIYNHLFDSMIRGTALNLSNMENFEFLSQSNWLDDGYKSGPVVNSQRQLWSVAALASTYLNSILGIEVKNNKLIIEPFITSSIRNTILNKSKTIILSNYKIHNKKITLKINLPLQSKNYSADEYYLVDKKIQVELKDIKDGSVYELTLTQKNKSYEQINILNINNPYNLSNQNFEYLFAPKTPTLYPIAHDNGKPHLYFSSNSTKTLVFNIYRNGKLIKENYQAFDYYDFEANGNQTNCYTIESKYHSHSSISLPSEPNCFWPKNAIDNLSFNKGKLIEKWGAPHEKLNFNNYSPIESGIYALQLSYNNFGMINTGITAAVKKITVYNQTLGKIEKEAVFMMPHHEPDSYYRDSNFIEIKLDNSYIYQFVISDFYNMSYFDHFQSYHYRGGRQGAYNYVNLSALKVLRLK